MTKQELTTAFAIAKAGKGDSADLDMFDGFGLPDFKPVAVTVTQVAGLIGWQCGRFDGKWDMHNLNEIMEWGRTRFLIVG